MSCLLLLHKPEQSPQTQRSASFWLLSSCGTVRYQNGDGGRNGLIFNYFFFFFLNGLLDLQELILLSFKRNSPPNSVAEKCVGTDRWSCQALVASRCVFCHTPCPDWGGTWLQRGINIRAQYYRLVGMPFLF